MVAISMYRGNLHKVPDVPRRWRMPDRNLSLKDFKSLLHRRKRALSRISLNLNPNSSLNVKTELITNEEDAISPERIRSSGKQKLVEVESEEIGANQVKEVENGRCDGFEGEGSDGGRVMELLSEKNTDDAVHEVKEEVVPPEIEEKQKEVEERLQVLNARKHNLVQVLKQILNAEEELKRRSIMQQQGATATAPSLPLHVDVSNDSGGDAGPVTEEGKRINSLTRSVSRSRRKGKLETRGRSGNKKDRPEEQ